MTNQNYIQSVDISDILAKHGNPVISIGSTQEYGINVYFAYDNNHIVPPDSADNLDSIVQKYNNQRTIEEKVTIGSKRYAYRGEVLEFEGWPEGIPVLAVPELPLCPVATLYENNLVVFWDFSRKLPANREAWRLAISWALKNVDTAKYPPKPSETTIRAGIVKVFKEAHATRGTYLENEVRRAKDYSESHLREAIDYQKKVIELQAQILSATALADKLNQKVDEFLLYLSKHKKIGEHFTDGTTLIMTTKDLTMSFRGETIKLPTYHLKYTISDGNFEITCPELAGKTRYIHTHVYADGRPCLGNYMTVYAKVVAGGEYRQMIDLLISFLETYNDNSPVTNFQNFRQILADVRK